MTSPGSSGEIDTWLSSLEADLTRREQRLGLIEKELEGAAVPRKNGGPVKESKLQTVSLFVSAQSTATHKHSIYEGFKQHDALMSSILNGRPKINRPTNPDTHVSPLPRTDLNSPTRKSIPEIATGVIEPMQPSTTSNTANPSTSPRHARLTAAAAASPMPPATFVLPRDQSHSFEDVKARFDRMGPQAGVSRRLSTDYVVHQMPTKRMVKNAKGGSSEQKARATVMGDVRERIRMADALADLGFPIDRQTMDGFMSNQDFDGVGFNSLVVLYQTKLKELSAHVARVVEGYPNKSKTSLVCGVLDALSTDDSRFAKLLRSLRPAFYDAIFVHGIDQSTEQHTLSFGRDLTWYELSKELSSQVIEMKKQMALEERSRKMKAVRKKMQTLFVERQLGKVHETILRLYFENWVRMIQFTKSQREKIIVYVGKQFSRNHRMELKYRYEMWKLWVKHVKEDRAQHEEYMNLTDELEGKERQIANLQNVIKQLKCKLKELFKLVRFNYGDLKAEMTDMILLFFAECGDAAKAGSQHMVSTGDVLARPEMVDNFTQTNHELEKITLMHAHVKPEKPTLVEDAPPTAAPKKKGKKKKVYKSKIVLTLAKVMDYIACMYEKKVKADKIDDKSGKDRDTLPEFCDDFFTQMFGIEALAGKKKYELEMGVRRHSKTEIRVKWFGTLIGWEVAPHDELVTAYSDEAINVYLYVLKNVFPPDAIEERMDDDPCVFKVDHCLKALNVLFRACNTEPAVVALMETLRNSGRKPKKGTLMEVELDFAFDQIMRTWYGLEEERRPKAPVENKEKKKK